eukprot:SM000133S26781  [mRNA]  locus=s133:22959:25284:- [translate_table: standard]
MAAVEVDGPHPGGADDPELSCRNGSHSRECAANYVVYSSEASAYLADAIAGELGLQRRGIVRNVFTGGEKYYRIDMDERYELVGKDVVYVCSTTTDDELLELVRVGCAFAAYGSRRRIFVIPFLGYSTMERQVKPGEVVTAKVNARIMSSIPNSKLGNIFLFMDLHVQSLLQYLEGPSVRMEIYAEHALLEAIRAHIDLSHPFMFASADLGRPLWVSFSAGNPVSGPAGAMTAVHTAVAFGPSFFGPFANCAETPQSVAQVESFARKFNVDVAFVRKSRNFEETKVQSVVGEVGGKHVIIYDDMTRSGSTLLKAADAYFERGATHVSAVLSHLALASAEVVAKLVKSRISTIICTNTHPMCMDASVKEASHKFKVVDVAPLFAATLQRLMHE